MSKMPLDTAGSVRPTLDATQLVDAGRQSASVLTATAELLSKTMSDIVSKQTALMRVEGDQIARSAAALASSDDPLLAARNYSAALRSGSEGAVSDLREIQDLIRGCAWSLFGLYVDAMSVGLGNGHLGAKTSISPRT